MHAELHKKVLDLILEDPGVALVESAAAFQALVEFARTSEKVRGWQGELAQHPHPCVRAAALKIAQRMALDCSGPDRESWLERLKAGLFEPEISVRKLLVSQVAALRPDGQPLMMALIHDEAPQVRHAAVQQVRGWHEFASVLYRRLVSDDSEYVAAAAALGLGACRIDDNWWSLIKALRMEERIVVVSAIQQALERLLASNPDWMPAFKPAVLEHIAHLEATLEGEGQYLRLPRLRDWLHRWHELVEAQGTAAGPASAEQKGTAQKRESDARAGGTAPNAGPDAGPDIGTNLKSELEAGRLDRAHEVASILDAIEQRLAQPEGSRSTLLVGERGVGKTAVVHELARRLIEQGWAVRQVGVDDIMVGTKYLGEWETRLSKLTEWAASNRKTLIYIPDGHLLPDAGRASDKTNNAADAIAPHVHSGRIAVLIESTPEALRVSPRQLGSLEGSLQRVVMDAAERAQTRKILLAVALERGHQLPGAFAERLVDLADTHLAAQANPGRSVQLLRRVLAQEPRCDFTTREILVAISRSTGLPVDFLDDAVPLDLGGVRRFLESRVMGQSEAIDSVLDLVSLVKSGLCDPARPLGVLMFVGPTGVGKTELARALAELIFGDPARMLRLDMSEYAGNDALYRLTGSGSHPGTLTSFVREQPFSVVLLDEFEKAHSSVFDTCLQLFDAGRLSNPQGHTTSMRGTVIIMTSNLGSAIPTEARLGFGASMPGAPEPDAVLRELRAFYRPEFLNRIDKIIHFAPLSRDTAERIARRELNQVLERSGITRRGLSIEIDPELVRLLLEQGYSPALGARPLKRTVERVVLLPLARVLCEGSIAPGSLVTLRAEGARCELQVVQPDAASAEDDTRETERESQALRVRAGALVRACEGLEPLVELRQARRTQLMETMSDPGFWSQRERSLAVTDELERMEGLFSTHQRLCADALAYAEWAVRSQGRERGRSFERLLQLELEWKRLRFLLEEQELEQLADAVVVIRLLKPQESTLQIVEKLARMYAGWAERHGARVEWLDDRCGLGLDSAALLLHGPGIHGMLRSEAGLHQFIRSETDRARDHRELARVEILRVDPCAAPLARKELRVDTRTDREARGRLVERPHVSVCLVHKPTLLQVEARIDGSSDEAVEKVLTLLQARLHSRAARAGNEVVRRYRFGVNPEVRDRRMPRSGVRLARLLEGGLDALLPALQREPG